MDLRSDGSHELRIMLRCILTKLVTLLLDMVLRLEMDCWDILFAPLRSCARRFDNFAALPLLPVCLTAEWEWRAGLSHVEACSM